MRTRTIVFVALAMIAAIVASAPTAGAQGGDATQAEAEATAKAEAARADLAAVRAADEQDSEVTFEVSEEDPLLGFTLEQWLPVYAEQRAMLGFDELNPEAIRTLAESSGGQASLEESGFLLTQDEQRELALRKEISNEVEIAVLPIAESIPGFAGMYVDEERKHVIGFTRGVEPDDFDALMSAVSMPERLSIRTDMDYTEAQIEALAAEARERFAGVEGVAINPEFDEGIVVVKTPPAAMDAVVAIQDGAPNTSFRIVEDKTVVDDTVCNWRYWCHTYSRGGVKALNEDISKWCTSGFFATLDSTGVDYLFVNAHCAPLVNQEFKVGGYKHSSLNYASLAVREEDLDTQGILMPGAQSSDRFYRTNGSKFYRTNGSKARQFQVIRGNAFINQNDVVCVHSYKVNRICGGIVDDSDDETGGLYATADNFTFLIQLPGEWGCSSSSSSAPNMVSGTSGAPVTTDTGNTLYGQMHSCSAANYNASAGWTQLLIWASKAENIEDDLGVTINTVANP